MKNLILSAMFYSFYLAGSAQNFNLTAKSGDTELDASLTEINIKAKDDLPLFKKDLSIEFNIGQPKIDKMLEAQLSPADIFMILQTAELTKNDPEIVMGTYKKNKDKGWGAIAKELGIKPGSPEFHALKGKAHNKKDKGHKEDKENGNNGHGKGHGKGKK
ncbi:MAG: hypothetical protein H0W61_06650 [Bacteroidetes bacterium]|nr:hypothetical protein [Bacteroidota bacterium]